MELRRRAMVGVAWSFAETWGTQLFQLVAFLTLARLLGPEGYGLVAIAMLVVLAGQLFVTNGGWLEALIQRRGLEDRHCDTAFACVVGVGVGVTGLGVLGAPLLGRLFGRSDLVDIMRCLAVIPVLSSITLVPLALLQREMRFSALTLRSTLATVLSATLGIGLALGGAGVWSLVAQEVALRVVSLVVVWRAHPWRPRLRFSAADLWELLPRAAPVFGASAAGMAEDFLLRGVVGYAFGPAVAGHLFLARKVVDVLRELLVTPWIRVALPVFARLQDRPESMGRALALVAQGVAVVAVPGFLGLAAVAPSFVPAVLGPSWRASIPLVQLLAVAGLLAVVPLVLAPLLQGVGRFGLELRLRLVGLLLTMLLLPFGLPFGIVGIAAALATRASAMLPIRLIVVQRALAVALDGLFGRVRPVLLAGCAMVALVETWRWALGASLDPTTNLIASVLIGGAAYIIGLMVLARRSLGEALASVREMRRSESP